jgi:hypothetical protein
MGYCGQDVPARMREVWETVKGGRDAAIAFVESSVKAGTTIQGAQVDDVARDYIEQRGYGKYFLHRTGHSIGYLVHGNGVNIDNLETRDQRTIIPGVCFSIEPGIYLPEFGVRRDLRCPGAAEVTGNQRDLPKPRAANTPAGTHGPPGLRDRLRRLGDRRDPLDRGAGRREPARAASRCRPRRQLHRHRSRLRHGP